MRGIVLSYSDSLGGLVSGSDGNRYAFPQSTAVFDARITVPKAEIDFVPFDDQATNIVLFAKSTQQPGKWIPILAAIFLGWIGIDRFILGRYGSGMFIAAFYIYVMSVVRVSEIGRASCRERV